MSSSSILTALECDRGGCACHTSARRGRGNTHCPAHDDHDPSCTVTERDGRVLWNCKSGCPQDGVLRALVERGLLHEVRDSAGVRVAWHERKGRWLRPDLTVGLGDGLSIKDHLYGLDEVLKADAGRHVFLVEGEKARDALARWGLLAVGTFGATTDPGEEVLRQLVGRRIYLWPDADEPGRQQVRRLGGQLAQLGAEAYRVDWPAAPLGGDAADLLQDVVDKADAWARLRRLVEAAQQVGPPDEGVRFERVELGYHAVFEDAQARFRIDNLASGRSKDIEADLAVDLLKPWGWRTLISGRITLRSLSNRESWTRTLGKMQPGVAWDINLARFCTDVLEAERGAEAPMILLRNAKALPPESFLIEPLVLAHDVSIVYGDSGTGKSVLALAAALSVHEGIPLIGFRRPTTQLKVAYLDFEFSAEPHKDRMKRLLAWPGEIPEEEMPDMLYRDCRGGTLGDQLVHLTRAFGSHGVGFCILDSIGAAADGPLNDDETARRFYRQCQQLRVPVLAIAHVNKAGETLFGSAFWKHGCRLMWKVVNGESTNGRIALTLVHEKVNTGRRRPPLHLGITFGEVYEIRDRCAEDGEAPRPGTQLDRVAEALQRAPGRELTYRELSEETGIDANQLRVIVPRDNARFEVRVEEGRWSRMVHLLEQLDMGEHGV